MCNLLCARGLTCFARGVYLAQTSVLDQLQISTVSGLKALKSLRSLRALRPLRVVSRNENLLISVNALFQTIPIISSLAYMSGVIMWIIGIMMMSNFKGQFRYCKTSFSQLSGVSTKADCESLGGKWQNYHFNYDNLLSSITVLTKIIIGENWVDIMWVNVDSVSVDYQPKLNYGMTRVAIYFGLILILNIFIYNLFVGLVINNFKRIKDDIGGYILLNHWQRQWVDIQRFMIRKNLKIIIPTPITPLRSLCHSICTHVYFDRIIILLIFLNTVILGVIYRGISEEGIYTINVINNIFLSIFHVEALMKIAAFGWFYFKDSWNR